MICSVCRKEIKASEAICISFHGKQLYKCKQCNVVAVQDTEYNDFIPVFIDWSDTNGI